MLGKLCIRPTYYTFLKILATRDSSVACDKRMLNTHENCAWLHHPHPHNTRHVLTALSYSIQKLWLRCMPGGQVCKAWFLAGNPTHKGRYIVTFAHSWRSVPETGPYICHTHLGEGTEGLGEQGRAVLLLERVKHLVREVAQAHALSRS
jgi:hypothetical protein